MTNYIDYVLVQHEQSNKPFLFIAPAFSRLEDGDEVIVDTIHGKARGKVLASSTIAKDDDSLISLIKQATGAYGEVRKVVARVRTFDLTWEDEEDERIDINC